MCVNINIDIDICIKIYMHSGKTGNTSVSMKMYRIEKHMVFGVLFYSLNYLQTLNLLSFRPSSKRVTE